MLMRTDPFRELDRLTQQVFGNAAGTWTRPTAMPMDAWRTGDTFVVAFDLPGVDPAAIDLDVERNVLTVKAERRPAQATENVEMQVAERPLGVFSRQLFLGDTLDADRIDASYEAGVLTLRIPIAERAKPRKITIGSAESGQRQSYAWAGSSSAAQGRAGSGRRGRAAFGFARRMLVVPALVASVLVRGLHGPGRPPSEPGLQLADPDSGRLQLVLQADDARRCVQRQALVE